MATSRCRSCTEPGKLTCTSCGDAKFCSKYCQEADWQFHKVLCNSFEEFETRPSPDMRRVLFFPPDDLKPRFLWLPMSHDLSPGQSVDYSDIMEQSHSPVMVFNRNEIIGATLDLLINLCYDDSCYTNYNETNKAAIVATNNKLVYDLRGPLLAYCGLGPTTSEILRVEDMDMTTYADLVANLIDYYNETPAHSLRKGSKVEAMQTFCSGERAITQLPFARPVKIPRMHPIFDAGEPSPISEKLDMPLLLWKDSRKGISNAACGYYCNEKVTFMQTICDPEDKRFGWAKPDWLGGQVPNILIARSDFEPLHADIVEAIGDYCQYHMIHCFQWQGETGENDEAKNDDCKQAVMRQLTPDTFVTYFSQWQSKKSGAVVDLAEGVARMGLDEEDGKELEARLFGLK